MPRFNLPDPHSRLPKFRDRVLVVSSSAHALELMRWATIRSDDILFVSEAIDPPIKRFALQFAIEVASRSFVEADLDEVAALLLSLPDIEFENRIVRSARRRGVAVHVHDRPLVSDLTVLALLEQPSTRTLAA